MASEREIDVNIFVNDFFDERVCDILVQWY
jgi:hypothetical protein